MPGVTAIVLNPARTRLLVVRRADDGRWTPVTGIVDPGEEPARAAEREVAEEAGIACTALRLLDMRALPEITYPNGDRAQYLDICFLCEADDSQRPFPADGENTEARWRPVEDLPPMNDRFREQLALALEDRAEARFRR
ncbi:NUDIX domain-containing protein [Brachybacterium paraconglomeratum]|jgi:8-oxo-dGTP pyrophosphatase MutT (NUDIX family)|uniref:NUDIX domain-containing protein n=2 Tax=Brachybacterium TaxID=43668 RepID=UPI0037CACE29